MIHKYTHTWKEEGIHAHTQTHTGAQKHTFLCTHREKLGKFDRWKVTRKILNRHKIGKYFNDPYCALLLSKSSVCRHSKKVEWKKGANESKGEMKWWKDRGHKDYREKCQTRIARRVTKWYFWLVDKITRLFIWLTSQLLSVLTKGTLSPRVAKEKHLAIRFAPNQWNYFNFPQGATIRVADSHHKKIRVDSDRNKWVWLWIGHDIHV